MSAMELDNDVSTVLATLRSETESPDLIQIFYELEDLYERKLWHQLTLSLDQFYSNPEAGGLKKKIFNSFISNIFLKLNPIKVTDFLLESFSGSYHDTADNLNELEKFYTKQIKSGQSSRIDNLEEVLDNDESLIYIRLQIARNYLLLKEIVKAEDILDHLDSKFNNADFESNFSSKINAAYYLAKCQLHHINNDYDQFYFNGLLYLSSVDSLLHEEEVKLCYDLCITALLGSKIFNFGELILHSILNVIKDNEYSWLYQLIVNLNSGNLVEFNKWLEVSFKKAPFLVQHEQFLRRKIVIMSLLELIARKSTSNKQLSFEEISEFAGIPVNDVEHLIIKCFSLNLIQGHIDQIDQKLVVTWLQPRILDLGQIKTLYDHLIRWTDNVSNLAQQVDKGGSSIWTDV